MSQPNIVLLVTDDQGFGDLGCYTNGKVHTPNLDELHATSVRMNQFYVSPLCSPTRAAILTGCYPERVGVWDTGRGMANLRPGTTTLADILRHEGYRTGVFGKWHTGSRRPQRPSDTGFDRSAIITRQKSIYDYTIDIDNEEHDAQAPREEAIFDQAMRFIEENAESPFFAYVASFAPLPGQRAARDVEKLCAHIDILPTVVALCGGAMPEGLAVDGTSLAPLLSGEAHDWPERIIVSRNDRLRHPRKWYNTTVRNSRFKLCNGSELYRLGDDPGESDDLSREHPGVVGELRRKYETWWDDITRSNEGFTPSYFLFKEHADTYPMVELTEPPLSVGIEKQDSFRLPKNDEAVTTEWKYSEGVRVKVEQTGVYDFSVNGIRRELLTDGSQCELRIGDALYVREPGGAESVEFARVEVPPGLYFIGVRITNLSSMPVTSLICWDQGFRSLSYIRSAASG